MTCQMPDVALLPASSVRPPRFIVGVDVAKAAVEVAVGPMEVMRSASGLQLQKTQSIANRERSLKRFLTALPAGSVLIVESTGKYHRLICDLAYALEIPVFMVDPYRVNAYRKADSQRSKTDPCDARLLMRFGREKYYELRPYIPMSPELRTLQALIRARSHAVHVQVAFKQNLEDTLFESPIGEVMTSAFGNLRAAADLFCAQFATLIKVYDQQIKAVIDATPALKMDYERLLAIPGVGKVTATSLLCALYRGDFKTAESFIAFVGLDPVARDSGQASGRRHLSKKGDPQLRSVLFMAAMVSCQHRLWKDWVGRYKARGLKHAQIACIVARRIATIAWCLVKKCRDFNPDRMFKPAAELAMS